MKIKWLGHASVLITSDSGLRIITDPYKPGYFAPPGGTLAYGEIREPAEVVIVTHEHPDHNNVATVRGMPEVVRGSELRQTGPITVRGITFSAIPCYHDGVGGSLLGDNNMVCFELDGLRICHTGDIGHRLSDEQVSQLGGIDVLLLCVGLLVPVGECKIVSDNLETGRYSYEDYIIDADVANQLYDQLTPKVIIPIHYGNENCSFKLVGVDEFCAGKKNVKRLDASEVLPQQETLPAETEIIVLEPAL